VVAPPTRPVAAQVQSSVGCFVKHLARPGAFRWTAPPGSLTSSRQVVTRADAVRTGGAGCRIWLPGLPIDRSPIYNVGMTSKAMQEPTFLILTALAAGAQHGYGIITDVAGISGGRVRLGAGTLYAAIDRLRGDGLIDADREEIVDGRVRRYYRLTPSGADALAAETARIRSNAAVATRRLKALGMSAS